jgi:hypothetical protein
MMQSQIHLKKAGQTAKSRELASKNRSAVLAPVMELNKKQKKDDKSDDFKARKFVFLPLRIRIQTFGESVSKLIFSPS